MKGRKVKMLPHCFFYSKKGNNQGIIMGDAVKSNSGQAFIMVNDGECVCACLPSEIRYLNNKEVKVDK